MAKKLDSFEFKGGVGGNKYPWDEWLDGDIWQLDSDDFGETDAKYVAHQARNAGLRRKLKVKVSLNEKDQVVTLQAFPMSNEEVEKARRQMEKQKAKQKEKRAAKKAASETEEEEEETPAGRGKGKGKNRKAG